MSHTTKRGYTDSSLDHASLARDVFQLYTNEISVQELREKVDNFYAFTAKWEDPLVSVEGTGKVNLC